VSKEYASEDNVMSMFPNVPASQGTPWETPALGRGSVRCVDHDHGPELHGEKVMSFSGCGPERESTRKTEEAVALSFAKQICTTAPRIPFLDASHSKSMIRWIRAISSCTM
jgi:hypothetical protein